MNVDLPAAPGRKARRGRVFRQLRQGRDQAAQRTATPADGLPETISRDTGHRPRDRSSRRRRAGALVPADDPSGQRHRRARRIIGFYRLRWTIEQLFRTMKTKGFDVEALRQEQDGPLEKLVTAILIAAVKVMQLVAERDGKASRPLADVFDPDDQPAMERVCKSLEGKTEKQKNPIPKVRSHMPPGSSQDLAAGPATMESQAPSSCSEASHSSTPSSMDGTSEMCKSSSLEGEGRRCNARRGGVTVSPHPTVPELRDHPTPSRIPAMRADPRPPGEGGNTMSRRRVNLSLVTAKASVQILGESMADTAEPVAVALDDATVAFRVAGDRVYTAVERPACPSPMASSSPLWARPDAGNRHCSMSPPGF